MEETEPISQGDSAKTIGQVISYPGERKPWAKCEKCQLRVSIYGRNWCRPCALQWQRTVGPKAKNRIVDYSPVWRREIPERYQGAELSDLPKCLVEQFIQLADDMGLLLWGEPGRGKTYSAAAFAKYLWFQGWDFKRLSFDSLMLAIRDTYKPAATETELSVITPLIEVGKLFLEDVGTTVSLGSQESDFSLRIFVQILDKRIEHGRATFVTTNKSIEELGRSFDARVASRLHQACEVIKLTGTDKRIRPK